MNERMNEKVKIKTQPMFMLSLLTNKTRIIHILFNALMTQYSENGSGYLVLEPVLEL